MLHRVIHKITLAQFFWDTVYHIWHQTIKFVICAVLNLRRTHRKPTASPRLTDCPANLLLFLPYNNNNINKLSSGEAASWFSNWCELMCTSCGHGGEPMAKQWAESVNWAAGRMADADLCPVQQQATIYWNSEQLDRRATGDWRVVTRQCMLLFMFSFEQVHFTLRVGASQLVRRCAAFRLLPLFAPPFSRTKDLAP